MCLIVDMQGFNLKVYWQHFIDIPELAAIRSLICFSTSQLLVFQLQSCEGISSSYFIAHFYSVIKTGHSFPGNSESPISNLTTQVENRSFHYI